MTRSALPLNPTRARIALGVLSLTYLVSYMDRTVLAVLQEPIKAEFGLSDWQLGLLGGPAFAILYSLMGVPIARLAERFDRGRLIAICVFFWSLMTGFCGLAQTYWHLLIARAGVSIGEAGGNPAAHSLIADLFPAETRARAVSFYTIGVPLGAFLGATVGGLLTQWYDWRTTFLILGAAGAVLVVIVLVLIPPVVRGRFDATPLDDAPPPSAMHVLRVLGKNRAFVHLAIGSALVVLVGYAMPAFLVSFMMRVHGLTVAEAGLVAGIVSGVGGLSGTLLAGWIADRLGPVDRRWYGWMSAVAMLIAFPCTVFGLLAGNVVVVTIFLTLGMALMFTYIPPTFAQIHAMVNARMRATAVSVFYLVINIVGMGLGPPLVGWLSDRLAARTLGGPMAQCAGGTDALAAGCTEALAYGIRYALVAICIALAWSVVHYWRAGLILGRSDHLEGKQEK